MAGYPAWDWLVSAALAAVPTILGHTLLNWSLRYLPASAVLHQARWPSRGAGHSGSAIPLAKCLVPSTRRRHTGAGRNRRDYAAQLKSVAAFLTHHTGSVIAQSSFCPAGGPWGWWPWLPRWIGLLFPRIRALTYTLGTIGGLGLVLEARFNRLEYLLAARKKWPGLAPGGQIIFTGRWAFASGTSSSGLPPVSWSTE